MKKVFNFGIVALTNALLITALGSCQQQELPAPISPSPTGTHADSSINLPPVVIVGHTKTPTPIDPQGGGGSDGSGGGGGGSVGPNGGGGSGGGSNGGNGSSQVGTTGNGIATDGPLDVGNYSKDCKVTLISGVTDIHVLVEATINQTIPKIEKLTLKGSGGVADAVQQVGDGTGSYDAVNNAFIFRVYYQVTTSAISSRLEHV